MKKMSLILVPVLAALVAGAQAQTAPAPAAPASAPDPSPLTANINLTTNYKFRGQDQGTTKYWSPAVQGGFDWSSNGFYLGNWNSNVSFGGNIEMDLYGGYKGEIIKDLGYDVGVLQYYYPHKGGLDYNTTEIYGALSYSFFSLKYSHTVSKDYFGIGQSQTDAGATKSYGRNTGYLDLSGNFPIDKWTINGHIGFTHYSSDLRNAAFSTDDGEGTITTTSVGVPNFYDYKLGVTYDLGSGFSAAGAIVGASKKSFYGEINKTRAILTISKSM
jgi:uncharacterized protein (TIGR02001 family)